MKVMITGATGYVGFALMQKLIEEGNTVHVLIRNPARAHEFIHDRIKVFYGDINNKNSLLAAMYDCQQVYHVAGSTDIWVKKPGDSIQVNYHGTVNVYEAALSCNVKRVVFTSTAGIMGPSYLTPLTEESPRITAFDIEYELSKKMAEDITAEYIQKGLEIVIVRPTKVFGGHHSAGRFHFMKYIRNFLKYQMVVIPGPGVFYANFCFVDDVANGHIQAMKYGVPGEVYILGGTNISYWQFFNLIRKQTGIRAYIIKMPKGLVKFWAHAQQILYYLLRVRPLYTPKSVKIVFSDHICSSDKAVKEIGYSITPVKDAIVQTIRSLKSSTQ
jgi:nucleoside-diphosphate-sugar epimerase